MLHHHLGWRHFPEAFLSFTFLLKRVKCICASIVCLLCSFTPKSLLQAPSTLALAVQATHVLLLLSYPPNFASAVSYALIPRWFGSNSTDLTKDFKLSSHNRHCSVRNGDAQSALNWALPALRSLNEILYFAYGWTADCCFWSYDNQVFAKMGAATQAFPLLFVAWIIGWILRKLTALSYAFGLFRWSFTAKLYLWCYSHSFNLVSSVKLKTFLVQDFDFGIEVLLRNSSVEIDGHKESTLDVIKMWHAHA